MLNNNQQTIKINKKFNKLKFIKKIFFKFKNKKYKQKFNKNKIKVIIF